MVEVVHRWLCRWGRRTALPLLFYGLLGTVLLSPLASPVMPDSPAQDLANHVSGIIEGRNALDERQFPIRVAPNQNDRGRYPLFQFYGNLPYTLGGWLCRTFPIDAYSAYKFVLLLSLLSGGFFTYRCGTLLARRRLPALAAGAVFVTAPYMLTDIHARFAFPEVLSFNLLPAVLYPNLHCLTSRRRAPVLWSGIAWCLLALSHNITFFYASLFLAAFHLSFLSRRRRALGRLLRAGGGYGLGLVLAAWYLAPQWHTLRFLNIGNAVSVDQVSATNWITPLGVLLAPGLTLPSPFPTPMDNPRFGVQVGWPILAAIVLAVFHLGSRARRHDRLWGLMLRLSGGFAVAFFMVWSPMDFWHYLPRMFSFVQFTYRLLMFVVLCGSLLAACVLVELFPRGMRFEHLAVCLCLTGYACTPYLGHHPAAANYSVATEMRHPNIGRGGANGNFRLCLSACSFPNTFRPPAGEDQTLFLPASEACKNTVLGRETFFHLTNRVPAVVQLPVMYYPDLLRVCDNGASIPFGILDEQVALRLPPGEHVVTVRFEGLRWANVLSLLGWAGTGGLLLASSLWPLQRSAIRLLSIARNRKRLVVGAILTGAVLLALGWGVHARRARRHPGRIRCHITASSCLDQAHAAARAFDGKLDTAWIPLANERHLAALTIVPNRAAVLDALAFTPRFTSLVEGWRKVEAVFYLRGTIASIQGFVVPDAPRQRRWQTRFLPVATDRLELFFSEPITETPSGDRVDEAAVRPGLAEVELLWK